MTREEEEAEEVGEHEYLREYTSSVEQRKAEASVKQSDQERNGIQTAASRETHTQKNPPTGLPAIPHLSQTAPSTKLPKARPDSRVAQSEEDESERRVGVVAQWTLGFPGEKMNLRVCTRKPVRVSVRGRGSEKKERRRPYKRAEDDLHDSKDENDDSNPPVRRIKVLSGGAALGRLRCAQ